MRNPASSRFLVAAIIFALTAAGVRDANAQALGFLRNLFNHDKTEETTEPQPDASETAKPADNACPETVAHFSDAQTWPESCGKDRPPDVFFEDDPLDGIWDIYTYGNDKIDEFVLYVHNRKGPLYRTDPNRPSTAQGFWRYAGQPDFARSGFSLPLSVAEDGTVEASAGQFGYCGCVSFTWRVKTVSPGFMKGVWELDDKKGVSIWRRRAAKGIVQSVSISSARLNANNEWVADEFNYGERAGVLQRRHPVTCGYGQMRGNCGSVWVTVRGKNFGGAHDIWIDPESHLELNRANWICDDGTTQNTYWNRCLSSGRPGLGVAGIQFRLILWDGMAPGAFNIWVDGQPIPINIVIDGYPETEKPPKPHLLSLTAQNAEAEDVASIEDGTPFMLTAAFDGDYPDAWTTVSAPGLPSSEIAGRLQQQEIVLERTEDPKILKSAWLAIRKSELVIPAGPAPETVETPEQ